MARRLPARVCAGLGLLAGLSTGCRGEGKWDLTATGGEAAETGLRSDAFIDACAATFGTVELAFQSVELIDEDGESGGGVDVPSPLDLAGEGPHTVGLIDVLEGEYDTLSIQLGTGTSPGVRLGGVLTCPAGTANFDWAFEGPIRLTCDGAGVSVANKGDEATLLSVTPDAVFSPTASDVDPTRAGLHILGLDDDFDGYVTLDELATATGDEAGLAAGSVTDDLRTHVTDRVLGMVAVDGGGRCAASGGG